jgi:Flp pilus assembly secretin CpaC
MKFSSLSAFAASCVLVKSAFMAVALSALAALPTETAASEAEPIVVTIDRAKVLKISKPADTVIIGNPSIADATIQDAQTLVLTGRSFGVTNLIIIDADGNPIVDETVVVQGHEANTVRIYRRSIRETLACSPVCEPTLTIGDNAETFTNANDQIKNRNALSDETAAAAKR